MCVCVCVIGARACVVDKHKADVTFLCDFCFDFVVAFREGETNRSCQNSYAFE